MQMADPNEHWSEQFSDALVLRHLARHATDFVDRARAREMLDKAEAEMARAAEEAVYAEWLSTDMGAVERDGRMAQVWATEETEMEAERTAYINRPR